jgi:hypothetical protein
MSHHNELQKATREERCGLVREKAKFIKGYVEPLAKIWTH